MNMGLRSMPPRPIPPPSGRGSSLRLACCKSNSAGGMGMSRTMRWLMAAGAWLLLAVPGFAGEPKHGGVWKIYHRDSPASASIHEEATYSTNIPFMPVMNNLVIYKQDEPRNSFET